MISEGLKKVIYNKLYKDLEKVDIIPYKGSIWFIDRESKYWYFELNNSGTLWWRYSFFTSFFELFSFDSTRFEPILKDWVEEVLNCKVLTTQLTTTQWAVLVEEVLNCKVLTTVCGVFACKTKVEEVLDYKVLTTRCAGWKKILGVEEVLDYKVNKTYSSLDKWVKEISKCTPGTAIDPFHDFKLQVEEVLNHEIINMDGAEMIDEENTIDTILNDEK